MDRGLTMAAFPHWDIPFPASLPQLTSSGLDWRLWGSSGPTPATTNTTVLFAWAKEAGRQGRHGLGRPLGLEKGG